jgi:hypothetical protein
MFTKFIVSHDLSGIRDQISKICVIVCTFPLLRNLSLSILYKKHLEQNYI